MGFWPVVENVIKNSDIILLVSDVRLPELSRNPELERKIKEQNKLGLQVFTKIDLVSSSFLEEKKRLFPDAYFVSATRNRGIRELRTELHILAKRMALEKPRVGVVGYPNIGKSAIINALARRARALVADKPGTTRGVQWIKSGSLYILDSPGVIPYEDKGNKLVLIGSKQAHNVGSPEKVALDIIRMFLFKDKNALQERYKIEIDKDDKVHDLLRKIGTKRGFLKKGGEIDETKTSIVIIQDWQKGRLKL